MIDVLHLSARDNQGGAARATYRLHKGLRALGVDSRMLVQKKVTEDHTVRGPTGLVGSMSDHARRTLDALPVHLYRGRDGEIFSPAWLPDRLAPRIAAADPEVVNLHWVAGGFLNPKTVGRIERPTVWTLHDMWPFTGGCHYTKSCTKYEHGCEACPHLCSDDLGDLSHSTWTRKHEAWGDCELTVVAPSHWLADCARDSALFGDARIEVIPNGLDTTAFRPQHQGSAHGRFGIDEDTKLVCFGADWTTQRKGVDLLYDALDALETPATEFTVVVFGRADESATPETDVDVRTVGFINGEDLRALYRDAAVIVVPSRQEAFGQTASEALASGTPVVAFDATGPRDIVDHLETGFLAEPFDSTELARGIDWVLSDEERLARLSERARSVAEARFDVDVVARQYRALYDDLL